MHTLATAHNGADLVYAFRTNRLVDPLYLVHALERMGLPTPVWVPDGPTTRGSSSSKTLIEGLSHGQPGLLFLRRPSEEQASRPSAAALVADLVAAQRRRARPIRLVPVALHWRRPPGRKTFLDAVLGDREGPGAWRELLGFYQHHRGARFHVGAPVDLERVLERDGHEADVVVAKKVRRSILHYLAREEHLHGGPKQRPAAETRQAILRDRRVRALLDRRMEQGHDPKRLTRQAERQLSKIAADMRLSWLFLLDGVVELIWRRIYDGIQVDEAGLERIRLAARQGPVIVVPSHKSHIDYLVLSQVFFRNDLTPPLVAAGENLDFWPIGALFRWAGAFFLRRSFKGDELYATVFAAYVRRLLLEGQTLEFFIEGGRSRTGKLRPPKMGMLAMCAEPVLEGSIPDAVFVPVSIGYEKIVEGGTFLAEVAGAEKRQEDMASLLSSAQVLTRRYGRVYVDFDEPISLAGFAAARGVALTTGTASEERERLPERDLVAQLGHRIVYGINRVTRVTPTSLAALVLLAHDRPRMGLDELSERTGRALALLQHVGARLSGSLEGDAREAALREALDRFVRDRLLRTLTAPDGTLIYRLDERGRSALDYYKNNILHFFVPAAVVAAAVLTASSRGSPEPTEAAVSAWARRISQLVKHEVSFRVGSTFEANFAEAMTLLERRGVIARHDGRWGVSPEGEDEAHELAGLLAVFFEAYRVLGESLAGLDAGPMAEEDLLDAALRSARRRALDGRLRRPEAASKPTLRQAIDLFVAEGAVRRDADGTLRDGDRDARARIASELETLLRVR